MYLECHWDETQEGVNKHAVHIDNVVLRFCSAIACVILASARSLLSLQVVKSGISSTSLGNGYCPVGYASPAE